VARVDDAAGPERRASGHLQRADSIWLPKQPQSRRISMKSLRRRISPASDDLARAGTCVEPALIIRDKLARPRFLFALIVSAIARIAKRHPAIGARRLSRTPPPRAPLLSSIDEMTGATIKSRKPQQAKPCAPRSAG